MIAVWVNTFAIIAGAALGLWIRNGLSAAMNSAMMKSLGLCTVVIGVQGAIRTENIVLIIVAISVGTACGTALDADGRINRGAKRLTARFAAAEGASRMAEAMVTACLIMNVGAMVVVGSLNAGLQGDYSMLYTKSILDLVAGIMLAAVMGVGVMGAAAFTLVFQGALVLSAGWIAPLLSPSLINEMSAAGCVMIVAIGLNMLEITKIKVIDMLPGLLAAPLLTAVVPGTGP